MVQLCTSFSKVMHSENVCMQMDTKGALRVQPGCAEKCFCSNYSLVLGMEGERGRQKKDQM